MGLRMESCRPWWCCSGSAPPPPGTGTGTALGPGGWPRLCRDGSPGGGGGLSSRAGLDDEWSGVPDGVFSSSELPSTDLPLPFSDAASGLWLLELEFSLFSLQVQEQSGRVSGETEAARRHRVAWSQTPPLASAPEPPGAARGCFRFLPFSPPGLGLSRFLPILLLAQYKIFSLLSFSLCHLYPFTSLVLNLLNIFPVLCRLRPYRPHRLALSC